MCTCAHMHTQCNACARTHDTRLWSGAGPRTRPAVFAPPRPWCTQQPLAVPDSDTNVTAGPCHSTRGSRVVTSLTPSPQLPPVTCHSPPTPQRPGREDQETPGSHTHAPSCSGVRARVCHSSQPWKWELGPHQRACLHLRVPSQVRPPEVAYSLPALSAWL